MYVMWAVHSNLSLWSNISTIFCSTHTKAALWNTSLRLLSAKEKRAYSPVTPPVSSCASDRCWCSDAMEIFPRFQPSEEQKVCRVPYSLNLFRTKTPSKHSYAVPRDGKVSLDSKSLGGIHFHSNTRLGKQLLPFLLRHCSHLCLQLAYCRRGKEKRQP